MYRLLSKSPRWVQKLADINGYYYSRKRIVYTLNQAVEDYRKYDYFPDIPNSRNSTHMGSLYLGFAENFLLELLVRFGNYKLYKKLAQESFTFTADELEKCVNNTDDSTLCACARKRMGYLIQAMKDKK